MSRQLPRLRPYDRHDLHRDHRFDSVFKEGEQFWGWMRRTYPHQNDAVLSRENIVNIRSVASVEAAFNILTYPIMNKPKPGVKFRDAFPFSSVYLTPKVVMDIECCACTKLDRKEETETVSAKMQAIQQTMRKGQT